MKHQRNILVKFLLYAVVLGVLLPALGRAPIAEVVVSALGLAAALYVAGDLFVLPYYGPVWAALADAGLATLTLWGLVLFFPGLSIPFNRLAWPALVIAGVEYLYHLFLRDKEPMHVNRPPENPG